MKKINTLIQFGLAAVVAIVLAACSGSESAGIDTKNAASAFINDNDNVVAFGSANLNDILTKADYKNVPKMGVILGGEVDAFKNILDLSAPMYYALEGPMDDDGPESAYAFMKVKNADSLVAKLIKMGYDIDESAEIKVGQDEGFAIGIKDDLAVVVMKDGDFDGKKAVKDVIKRTEGEPSGGKVDEILSASGDIVMGMSIEALYGTSDTDLSKLDEDKQKEIETMVAGSFVQTTFKFEEGAAIIETKNYFSQALMDRMFMNADKSAPVLAKLGKGTPRFGVSMNIDMKKMQGFMEEFSPDAADELARSMGGPAQMALMAGGKDGLAGIFSGKFGAVMFGDDDIKDANLNAFVGLTANGEGLGKMAMEFLQYGDSKAVLDKQGLAVFTNADYAPPGKLKLPAGCKDFGKSGFSAFMNFDGLDFDDLDLDGEANILRAVKYITVEYNNDGGRVYIKAVDGKENVLEQFMREAVNEMSDEIGSMSI